VVSIALGSFALVFSELIPVGMLPNIGGHLGVSVGVAGLMIVLPAIAAAISAPLLALGSSLVERRTIIWGLSAIVLASDVVAGLAPDYAVMCVSRVVLGVCIGGFWVFGAAAAMAIVRAEVRGTAVAFVSGGIFLATVAALPVASLIGNVTSWRVAFFVAAALALGAVALQLVAIPAMGKGKRVAPKNLLTVVQLRTSRIGLIAGGVIFFAHFSTYTYFTPLLNHRAGIHGEAITLVLLGFGVAGAITNFLAGVTVRRFLRATLVGSGFTVGAAALVLACYSTSRPLTDAMVFVWGAGFGVVPVAAQTWMAQSMPANIEGGLALFVSALQGSIALGSAIGGLIYDTAGTTGPLVLTAVAATVGSISLLGRAGSSINRSALAGPIGTQASVEATRA
jgi:predicted MFS family arabinose efflux permease